MKTLIDLLESGYPVNIDIVTKRMDGDWEDRYVWNSGSHECEWEGFKTATACVDDLIKHTNTRLRKLTHMKEFITKEY